MLWLAVMLAVDLIEHLPHLALGQTLGIETTGDLLTLLLLIPQDGQNLGMEVPETIPGNLELQFSTMAVCMAETVAVALVPVHLLAQKLTPLRHHQALQHNLQKVVKTIFFLGMLAHYLRKLFLCERNHKSVFLKLNMNVLLRHFKFTDFLLSTYPDTLFGTLSKKSARQENPAIVHEEFL